MDLYEQDDEGLEPAAEGDSDAIEEISDLDFSEIADSEGEEEEEGKEKTKKEKGEGSEEPMVSNEAIVERVLGPEVIKAEELRRFMIDVGMCTIQTLTSKFRDRIKDPERKAAFRTLLREHLTKTVKNGTTYVKLRPRTN
jgi:hypothetical protein